MLNNGKGAPLEGIRVLDLGRYQAGPRCALMLARLGADVIKVEPPRGEESRGSGPHARGQSIYWVQYNSGKRSLGIDLYSEKGKQVLRELIKVSDILVQNFRPGTMDAMGLPYDVLRSLNRKIVMVNVSAFGQYGSYRDRIGFDMIGQAISGLMMVAGEEGTPPIRMYTLIMDRITSLHATIGAMAALLEAQRSGEGQCLDVSLADTGYTLMEIPIAYYKETGKVIPRQGNGSTFTNAYQCSDGWVYLISTGAEKWKDIARAIGRPEWLEDPAFTDRQAREKQVDLIEAALAEWFGGRTVKEAVDTLIPVGVAISPINTTAQAAEDPHPWERELLIQVPDPVAGTILASGNILHYSRSELKIGPAATPGQHTEEILTDILGMSPNDIAQLKAERVI